MTEADRKKGSGLFDLSGKTALVTGSTRGLGLAMARGLAESGARVVINGRGESAVAETVKSLRDAGLVAEALVVDVTDEKALEPALAELAGRFPIDVLVNNVGIHDRAPLAEMTAEQWRRVIEVNLTSAFLVSRFVAPGMIDRGGGKIIHTCSLMSEVSRPTTGNYAAAKGGLKMLTRAMAVEWAKHNVQINGIGPGYFETELTKGLVADPEFNRWICGRTPAGRWGRPEELVGTAVFLASSASDFVNGQLIYVDGGLLAGV
ncbi:SDR family oxidoreductase [Mucisphaera sp.]|uniref:SDR family oxidoreductase n=1 Tax=Mucisphaera sp. TaxID=2913024 RepID=UPI003D1529BA